MEEKKRISVLFSRYVSGDAKKKEIAEMLELLKDENADGDLNAEMEHFWNHLQPAGENVDWNKMYDTAVSADGNLKAVKSNRTIWLSAAAMLVGILSVAMWFTVYKSDGDTVRYVTGKAGAGKTMIVYLNDGTKVTLNSGSELRYPQTFAGKKREVYLNGEAYFEVAHNPEKSFQVHSGKVVTSVLGTSFNVMAYPQLSKMTVTVLTGKVAVKNNDSKQLVTLLPKQRASLSAGNVAFAVDSVKDLSDMVAWSKGELVFNNATLEEIALKVGNRYGVNIKVASREKSQRRITGTFNKQSFIEIMDAVTHLTETSYKKTNDNFIID